MLHRSLYCFAAFALMTQTAIAGTPAASVETAYAQSGPLRIGGVTPNSVRVPRYGKFELRIDLSATYANPFDPDDIDVGADFTGPGGESFHVNGFLDQGFDRAGNPLGSPIWEVRFAPNASGTWRYHVEARDRSGFARSPEGSFRVDASANPGFVRVSKRNPSVFAFMNERPFFAVGEDMCWSGFGSAAGVGQYADWLPKLHAAGGNWIRSWMCSWSNGLEWSSGWTGATTGGYHGLGVYNLKNAARLDNILDLADANGIYTMLCFGTFGELTTGWYFHEGEWDGNPYNAANGGPCSTPGDFFTSPRARKLYRQRLRYIAARYGWRTGIHSWELWNEEDAPAPWVSEMSQFLKGSGAFAGHPADPYRHLITTTYGNPGVWKIPEVDWTESHLYGTGNIPDLAAPIAADAVDAAKYGKPHLMAEFGIDYRKPDTAYDPDGLGIDLHNGIWAAATSGDTGSAMTWWWDNYVDPKNLYREFAPLAKVASKIEWTAGPTQTLSFDPITQTLAAESFRDLVLLARAGWGKAPVSDFHLESATRSPNDPYPTYLYSPGKADLRTAPTFFVHYSRPGQFIVHVDTVSSATTLRIDIDGGTAGTFLLNPAPPADGSTPEYKSTEYKAEWKTYQALFDRDCAVTVPAGDHRIVLSVPDGDWISVDSYRLTNYVSNRYADAAATGVRVGGTALVWLHNLGHNWKNVADHTPVATIHAPKLTIHGLKTGEYRAVWFDTETGHVVRSDRLKATKLGATLVSPDLASDFAVLLQPV